MQKIQIIFLVYFFVAAMTDSEPPSTEAKVYIVHTENPQDQQPEEFHIKTLASVLGRQTNTFPINLVNFGMFEDAAKEALIYSYKHAASGFAAKLTPEQVSELAKKPGVLQIVPSRTLHLHGPELGKLGDVNRA
ncbi:hypothetical protein MTR67_047571 [Solanum verrucosum]|uniref:Inhibitor I9 domain-containing protein n=1 Tax=Solanum verrucosum TaxID=315347 RepID=A0AAF0UZL6_SOLVR|nr:hypothetical protein MTR67_047571 [Solanum verrucosum]